MYANANEASLGDNVLQAGTADGGIDPDDKIGTLFDYEPLQFDGSNNTIDAAIALSTTADLRNNTPDNGILYEQFTPSEEIAEPFVGQQVKKYGRTSELTNGQVAEINVTVNVCYEPVWIFCFKSAKFVGQIAVESINVNPFSEPGDSGSLIVTTEGNNPVGLLFAGSETRTLANPIGPVLSRFGVTIDGESAEPFADISMESVTARASVIEGDTIDVDVVVANVGNQDVTSDITVTLEDNLDPSFAPEQTIEGGLPRGASTTLTFYWNAVSLGDHILTASHDVVDDDSTNDDASTGVNVVESLMDVAVTEVRAPSSVVEGSIVEVDVTVWNSGNQVAENFDVTLMDTTDGPPAIGTETVSSLAAGASTILTYSWDTTGASIGDHTLEGSHNLVDDQNTANDTKTTTVEVTTQTAAGPHLWIGKRTVSTAGWETVNLDNGHDYGENMVVICTPNYEYHELYTPEPLVAHVQNASGSSFQVRLVQAVGLSLQHVSADVHCVAVEAGVYNEAEHGVKMEAAKFTSTLTDRKGSWVGEIRSYAQPYTNPVVVGQVMSLNSYDSTFGVDLWSAFWCSGSSRSSPPSSTALWVGKHAGEDPRTRDPEIMGYVVMETGSGSIGSTNYVAGLGSDSIRGVYNSPPYNYAVSGITSPATAVTILGQAAMDGGDGSWAVLYGDDPITASGVNLAVDEDMAWDSERKHTTEQVGYIVFE